MMMNEQSQRFIEKNVGFLKQLVVSGFQEQKHCCSISRKRIKIRGELCGKKKLYFNLAVF